MALGELTSARLKIEITESDISKATKGDSYKCMVAQAIARTVPDATHIDVDIQTIRFTRRDSRYIYNTPYAVQGYVVAFDAGDPIEPFNFQLRNARKIAKRRFTQAGQRINREIQRVRRRARRQSPQASPAEIAATVKTAYRDAAASARAEFPDQPKMETVVEPGAEKIRQPPRVFKRKNRHYGHRVLRINRELSPDETAAE